jgi:hypothetical protein
MSKSKGGKKDKRSKSKSLADANAVHPKRPVSSYFYFANEYVPKLKLEKEITHKNATSEAGAAW